MGGTSCHAGHCLESIRGVVDDIVVVDTGSKDDRDVARRYGAACSLSLVRQCGGAERVAGHARGQVDLLMDSDGHIDAATARSCASIHKTAEKSWHYVVVGALSGPAREEADVTVGRISSSFRNYPQWPFEGASMSNPPDHPRLERRDSWTDLVVVIPATTTAPKRQKRKLERDLRLLPTGNWTKRPEPLPLFNLSMTCTDASRYEDGAPYARRSIGRRKRESRPAQA